VKTVAAVRTALIGMLLLAMDTPQGRASDPPLSIFKSHHELNVVLEPDRSVLSGQDRINIQGAPERVIDLILSPEADIRTIRLNGRRPAFIFDRGRLRVQAHGDAPVLDLLVDYTCRFDDPAPTAPGNTDNPGYGVSGTIDPSGTFLLSGAGWYPRLAGARESLDLRVQGPQGTVAVTAGSLLGIQNTGQRTISHWRIENALEGLSLSAGPYVVDRQNDGRLKAATFFYPRSRRLSPRYLEASLRYLQRYDKLFGPYPFDGFAVVENFFPTGYGFPSYTLMGSRVLQLPFIPETSLPHEIVHNWWGNGVLVDFAAGNWCEGLATYTADYLNQERNSAAAARDYRRQAIRNYASLVSPENDFPLNRFQSRTDSATKAVGYDKSAMVFHMLRKTVGEEAFWDALRGLYQQYLFKRASWQDLQDVFERQAGRSLEPFFRQWITRPGAPHLRMEAVRTAADANGFRTIGRLVQKRPYYEVALDLVLETDGDAVHQTVRLTEAATDFVLHSIQRPRVLVADPDYHLFRHLAAEEIPPTVNSLKGTAAVIAVLSDRLTGQMRAAARQFTRFMGIDPVRWVGESDLSAAAGTGADLLFIGLPESVGFKALFPQDLRLTPRGFTVENRLFDDPTDVLFCVVRHPVNSSNIVALLHPLSQNGDNSAFAKIPHYGRYSYLAFRDGRNQVKGTWETQTSPMKIRLSAAASP